VIEELLRTAGALTAILTRENLALRAMDLAQAVALLEQKGRATAEFAAANAAAAAAGLTEGQQRRAAAEVGQRLRALVGDNRALLERAMLVQRRIMGTIAEAAPRAAPAPRYDASGGIAGARRLAPVALSTRA
jgi:hypothetical protein